MEVKNFKLLIENRGKHNNRWLMRWQMIKSKTILFFERQIPFQFEIFNICFIMLPTFVYRSVIEMALSHQVKMCVCENVTR